MVLGRSWDDVISQLMVPVKSCHWHLANSSLLVSWTRVSSTLGSGCVLWKALRFIGFRLTQILTVLPFLGTTTTPLYHGVALSNFDMMQVIPCGPTHFVPSDKVVAETCGVCRMQMILPGVMVISKSLTNVPRPENNLGLLSFDFNWYGQSVLVTKALFTGKPDILCFSSLITWLLTPYDHSYVFTGQSCFQSASDI